MGQEGKNTAQIQKETKGSHLTSKQHAFSSLAADCLPLANLFPLLFSSQDRQKQLLSLDLSNKDF